MKQASLKASTTVRLIPAWLWKVMKWGVLPVVAAYVIFSLSVYGYFQYSFVPKMTEWSEAGLLSAALNPTSDKFDSRLIAAVTARDIDRSVEILEEKVRSGEADAGAFFLLGTILPDASDKYGDTDARLARANEYLAEGAAKYPDAMMLALTAPLTDDDTGTQRLARLRGNPLISEERHQRLMEAQRKVIIRERQLQARTPLYEKWQANSALIGEKIDGMRRTSEEIRNLPHDSTRREKRRELDRLWHQLNDEAEALRREGDAISEEMAQIDAAAKEEIARINAR